MSQSPSLPVSSSSRSMAFYVWLGVLGQVIWGSYPVFAKRAMQEFPKFSLLAVATLAAGGASLWLIRREDKRPWREIFTLLVHARALWALAFFVVLRSVSNILAISLTRATWVQLVYLMTPFMVAILGTLFFDEVTPRYTYQALLLSTVGAALALVEDWAHALAGFTSQDVLGLVVAFFSMTALATYFQFIRRSRQRQASNGLIMFQQSLAIFTTYLILTWVTGEDWSQWTRASTAGWMYALLVIFWVQVGGNVVQITAIGGASPALITSLMPLRLISALVLGWLVLGEQLHTVWQWLGASIVLVTVSTYLWLQGRDDFRTVR